MERNICKLCMHFCHNPMHLWSALIWLTYLVAFSKSASNTHFIQLIYSNHTAVIAKRISFYIWDGLNWHFGQQYQNTCTLIITHRIDIGDSGCQGNEHIHVGCTVLEGLERRNIKLEPTKDLKVWREGQCSLEQEVAVLWDHKRSYIQERPAWQIPTLVGGEI